jgi:signal transduction histidine kinase
LSLQSSQICLIYKDNGRALIDVDKDKIFMPFYTTQRGALGRSGLGVYILFNVSTQLLQGAH